MAELLSLEEYRKQKNWDSEIIKDSDILTWIAQHNFISECNKDLIVVHQTAQNWDLCFEQAIRDLYKVIDIKDVTEILKEIYPIKVYRTSTTDEIVIMSKLSPSSNTCKFLFRAKSVDDAKEYILKNCELTLEDFYEFNDIPKDDLDVFRTEHKIPLLTKMTSENWNIYYREFLNMKVPPKEEKKMPEPDTPTMNVKSVKDIVGIAADFDWEGVFDIEKRLGYFEDVDCTDLESKNNAIEHLRDTVLENIIAFVLRCEREGHKDRFLEIQHSLRIEYYDGVVMLRYQPIVYDNYE